MFYRYLFLGLLVSSSCLGQGIQDYHVWIGDKVVALMSLQQIRHDRIKTISITETDSNTDVTSEGMNDSIAVTRQVVVDGVSATVKKMKDTTIQHGPGSIATPLNATKKLFEFDRKGRIRKSIVKEIYYCPHNGYEINDTSYYYHKRRCIKKIDIDADFTGHSTCNVHTYQYYKNKITDHYTVNNEYEAITVTQYFPPEKLKLSISTNGHQSHDTVSYYYDSLDRLVRLLVKYADVPYAKESIYHYDSTSVYPADIDEQESNIDDHTYYQYGFCDWAKRKALCSISYQVDHTIFFVRNGKELSPPDNEYDYGFVKIYYNDKLEPVRIVHHKRMGDDERCKEEWMFRYTYY